MSEHTLRARSIIALPRSNVFAFFSKAENLGRITPPALGFVIKSSLPIEMRAGAEIDYSIKLHGIPMRWRTLISTWDPPNEFVDEQLLGPYAQWIHRHTFTELGPNETLIEDEVRYRLPFGILGDVVHPLVRRQLNGIFTFREGAVARIFATEAPFRGTPTT